MNPAEWLKRTALRHPGRPALLLGESVIADYATFFDQAARVSAWLAGQGIAPGDRVALFSKNCPDYLIALYGIWHAGAIAVPINGKLHVKEAAFIIENAGATLAFVSGSARAELASALSKTPCALHPIDGLGSLDGPGGGEPHATQAHDTVWLFYTSGTTGRPKGVMLTALNLMTMTLSYLADVDDVSADDAILYAAPMSHGAGLYNFVHVLRGARHVVPASGDFDARDVLDLSKKIGRVSMFAAPTMVRRLTDLAGPGDADGIKTIVYGGGPMYLADIIDAVEAMGPRFVQIYGQGESPMAITALSRAEIADRSAENWRARLASVGRAQSAVRIRIAREDGSEAAVGEIGEVTVQGALVMPGYWQDGDSTAGAIRDGWLWTGDMGALDADGYLTLHDRSKDVIISGGTNIYPREVEEVLLAHESVHEVSVVGQKDADWGEKVVAFVVLKPGLDVDEADLDRHCLAEIARFKRPKAYIFVPELPKNNYGKVLKTVLRDKLETTDT